MPRQITIVLFFFWCSFNWAQSQLVFTKKATAKIRFEWNANLIIIPVSIQGVELRFLVDTGVGHTLIFDTHKAQQLGLNQERPYLLRGLGDQPALEAYQVNIDQLSFSSFYMTNITALVLPESEFVLSKRLGTQIDGIIGYDLFEHYPVLIDYPRKLIKINPLKKKRKWEKRNREAMDLSFYKRKPYVHLDIPSFEAKKTSGYFLLDTGLSDALWLFSKEIEFNQTPPVFEDFLGTGINGDVHGKRGKIPSMVFGKTHLNEIKVAYPDSTNFSQLSLKEKRLGSVGAELLSRFKLLFDYPNKQLMVQSTSKTTQPFYYNLSGIEIAYEGFQMVRQRLPTVERQEGAGNNGIEILLQDRFQLSFHPALTVTYVRPYSAADQSGIKVGDVLIQINGKKVHQMNMEKVLSILQKQPGEKVRITIRREGQLLKFTFRLASLFSTKVPSP